MVGLYKDGVRIRHAKGEGQGLGVFIESGWEPASGDFGHKAHMYRLVHLYVPGRQRAR